DLVVTPLMTVTPGIVLMLVRAAHRRDPGGPAAGPGEQARLGAGVPAVDGALGRRHRLRSADSARRGSGVPAGQTHPAVPARPEVGDRGGARRPARPSAPDRAGLRRGPGDPRAGGVRDAVTFYQLSDSFFAVTAERIGRLNDRLGRIAYGGDYNPEQ